MSFRASAPLKRTKPLVASPAYGGRHGGHLLNLVQHDPFPPIISVPSHTYSAGGSKPSRTHRATNPTNRLGNAPCICTEQGRRLPKVCATTLESPRKCLIELFSVISRRTAGAAIHLGVIGAAHSISTSVRLSKALR